MYSRYPLFRSHIDLAHKYWKELIKKGDAVIDATCGNGHDTLVLSQLALTPSCGSLTAFDIQKTAIESSQEFLCHHLSKAIFEKIRFIHGCHSEFPLDIPLNSIKLIVYNLGYLPGGNKLKTTITETTLKSLNSALSLIKEGGAISITCYPGHLEGAVEEKHVIEFSSHLEPREWNCCHHRWMNKTQAPSLILIQKKMT